MIRDCHQVEDASILPPTPAILKLRAQSLYFSLRNLMIAPKHSFKNLNTLVELAAHCFEMRYLHLLGFDLGFGFLDPVLPDRCLLIVMPFFRLNGRYQLETFCGRGPKR